MLGTLTIHEKSGKMRRFLIFLLVRRPVLANSASARKRIRQAIQSRQHNMGLRSKARTKIKNVITAIEKGDKEQAQKLYNEMVPVVDNIARKGLYHKNKIARHKSRLIVKISAMA